MTDLEKVAKGFRLPSETKRLIEVLAVIEGLDEGDLLSRLLDAYLHYRSPQYRTFFANAADHVRKMLAADPGAIEDATSELRKALSAQPEVTPAPAKTLDEAKERLIARLRSRPRSPITAGAPAVGPVEPHLGGLEVRVVLGTGRHEFEIKPEDELLTGTAESVVAA